MDNENIGWLTTIPAGDCNFKSHLQEATVEEIKTAISILDGKKGSITKIKELKKELRRRGKDEQRKD